MRLYQINLPLFRSVDVSDPVPADSLLQLGLGQLLSVHTVVHHGQLVHLQVVADAQLPAEFGDVLDRLISKLLLTKRVFSDLLLRSKAIDEDYNCFVSFVKNEFEIDILGVPISDAKA